MVDDRHVLNIAGPLPLLFIATGVSALFACVTMITVSITNQQSSISPIFLWFLVALIGPIGIFGIFYRCGVVLDRSNDKVIEWHGLLVPMYRRQYSLSGFSRIEISKRQSVNTEGLTLDIYVVTLNGPQGEILLFSDIGKGPVLVIAERVRQFSGLELIDACEYTGPDFKNRGEYTATPLRSPMKRPFSNSRIHCRSECAGFEVEIDRPSVSIILSNNTFMILAWGGMSAITVLLLLLSVAPPGLWILGFVALWLFSAAVHVVVEWTRDSIKIGPGSVKVSYDYVLWTKHLEIDKRDLLDIEVGRYMRRHLCILLITTKRTFEFGMYLEMNEFDEIRNVLIEQIPLPSRRAVQ